MTQTTLLGAAGSGNWLPTNIDGCVIWLRADLGVTTTEAGVTVWKNQGSVTETFVSLSGQEPTLTASAINGCPAITFESASKDAFRSSTEQTFIADNGDRTIVAVKREHSDNTGILCANGYYGDGGSVYHCYFTYANPWGDPSYTTFCGDAAVSGHVITNRTFTPYQSWHFQTWIGIQATDAKYVTYFNGSETPDTVLSYGTMANESRLHYGFVIGTNSHNGNPTQPYNGDLAELMVWNKKLSASDLRMVTTYIKTRYGL